MAKAGSRRPYALSIDPGVTGTGVALWSIRDWKRLCGPMECFNVYPSGDKPTQRNWYTRGWDVIEKVKASVPLGRVRWVYLEFPAYFQSAGGRVTARSGDLVKLSTFVGMLTGQLGRRVYLVPVNDWKGDLSKSVVELRIRQLLGPEVCKGWTQHTWDAVGIGLYMKGHF